ncbi:MAG TPA: 50S ribosomal protein L9 [Patescibacteria group bacterium]|nr:50S ribosomal protein L9 [Patescibacteria group bacterium]
MKLILQQDVKKLGKQGEIVDVSEGYARNFLLPQKLALPASNSNLNVVKQQKASEERKKEQALDEAKVLAAQLAKVGVTINVKQGEGGKLFGSVTAKDIAEAMQSQYDIEMDKRKIELKDAIKTLGEFPVTIKLHPEVNAQIQVTVKPV